MKALLQLVPKGACLNRQKSDRPALDQRHRQAKGGSTLVEIMMACIILGLLAVSFMTAIFQVRTGLAIQKNRSLALEMANSRLEELRSTPYTILTALISTNFNTNFIQKVNGKFVLGSGETVFIGNKPMPITTTLQYADVDSGTRTYNYLCVTTWVQYRTAGDVVKLQTMKGP